MNVPKYWTGIERRRLNRRRVLAATATGVAGAALLAACGGDDNGQAKDSSGLLSSVEDATKTAKRGGLVKGFVSGEPASLDPMPQGSPLHLNIKPPSYQSLVVQKPGYLKRPDYKELLPNVAESWEYSPDRLTITMKLFPGLKFHNKPPVNGRAVTVEDIVFSWERYERLGQFRSVYSNKASPDAR